MTANPLTLKYKSDGTLVLTAQYLDISDVWQDLTGATINVTIVRLGVTIQAEAEATEIGDGVYELDLPYDITADPGDILVAQCEAIAASGSRTYSEIKLKVTKDDD